MTDVETFLEKAMSIDGAIGAALVDQESGMCLGTRGGGTLDMELAGASAIKIVQAKEEIIDGLDLEESAEETLCTMKGQYHLIRMSEENENMFSYLILDREESSLALARTHLKSIDQNLSLDPEMSPEEAFS